MATKPQLDVIKDPVTGNQYSRDTSVAGSTYARFTPITSSVNEDTINNIDVNKLNKKTGTYTTPTVNTPSATGVEVNNTANTKITTPTQPTAKEQTQSFVSNLLGRDVLAEKTQAREAAGLQTKMEEANKAINEVKVRKQYYEKQIEKLQTNPEGKFGGALQQEVEQYQQKANKDLANMAVSAELLQDNYLGAEKILNAQIEDIQTSFENDTKKYQIAMDFMNNDMSESEKVQAQQAFEEKMLTKRSELDELSEQRDYIRQKGLLDYKAGLDAQAIQSLAGSGTILTDAGKPMNDTQSTAYGYAERLKEADKIITPMQSKFTGIQGIITGNQYFPNFLKTQERQSLEQAQRNFINAVLRRESGAVISPSEFENAAKQYFPQPGDAQATLLQKQRNRTTVTNNLIRSAGVSGQVQQQAVNRPEDLRAKYQY